MQIYIPEQNQSLQVNNVQSNRVGSLKEGALS